MNTDFILDGVRVEWPDGSVGIVHTLEQLKRQDPQRRILEVQLRIDRDDEAFVGVALQISADDFNTLPGSASERAAHVGELLKQYVAANGVDNAESLEWSSSCPRVRSLVCA